MTEPNNVYWSTSAQLRQTQHELAHAQFELATATARIAALTDDLKQARLHIDGYHADYQEWDGEKQEMVDASLALKADLARVTAERDQFRSNYLRDAARVDQLDGDLVDMELDLADSRALVVQVQQERDLARAELASATAELESLRELVEMTCGRCWGLGLIPAENFGRDADGAPWTDEEQPCPDGCEIPRWLQAERNDAADDARLLASARAELEQLRAQLHTPLHTEEPHA